MARRRYSSSRARRPVTWDSTGGPLGLGPLSMDTSLNTGSAVGVPGASVFFAGAEQGEDITLMRSRGQIVCRQNTEQPQGDEDLWQVSYGIGVATAAALDAGALPQPIADADWDGWLLYGTVMPSGGDALWYTTHTFDSKAMRRVEGGYGLFAAFQATLITGVGTRSIATGFFSRFLLKTS